MLRPSYRSLCRRVRSAALSPVPGAVLLGIVFLLGGCRSPNPAGSSENAAPDSGAAPADVQRARPGEEQDTSEEALTVLVVGNSLTAGYGLSEEEAFPALLQHKADSAGFAEVEVVNAGNSGETTAGGRRRIDWLLKRPDVDVLLLELGANDALRGLPPDSARANLRAIIDKTKARFPDVRVVLAGMKAPPNMGNAYTKRFEQIYPQLAEETNARLIPFLLEGVAGEPALNQSDGIHPTAQGQRLLAQNAWAVLGPLLEDLRSPQAPAGA